jgi:type 2 lantibiotic biosynthesis protein LanM
VDPGSPQPFEELFLPLLRVARGEVTDRVGGAGARLEAAAHAALERALLGRLVHVCAQPLYGELAGFRACRQQGNLGALCGTSPGGFQKFMAGMQQGRMLTFLRTYPVAARLCGTVTGLWIDTVAEFLERLDADAPDLARTFGGGREPGTVASIEASLSDPHLGGRSVLIARFTSGLRVVYKPRPVGMERFYAEVVESVNRAGGLHPLKSLAVLSRPTHGWIEYAEHRDCEDHAAVERYFERCGMLLCLAHVLGAGDFHFENLIACGDDPVLIDMEGLVNHRFSFADDLPTVAMPARESTRRWARSVLNTRLLPTLKASDDGLFAPDIGGLSRMDEKLELVVGAWEDVNRDGMRLARRRISHQTEQRNLPRVAGAQISAMEHVDLVVAGYRHTYRLLLGERGEWLCAGGLLDLGRGHRARFLLRDTNLYLTLLERCLHPKYLRSGVDRGIELDALARTLLRTEDRPAIWPLLGAERDALERLDVPYFDAEVGSTDLELPSGVITGCFSASALDEVRERLQGMSGVDLEFQEAAIRTSFDALREMGVRVLETAHAVPCAREPAAPGLPAGTAGVIERVADAVLARAQPSPSGELSWMAVTYLARARRHMVAPATLGLADGYTGPALFLAALASHTGSEHYQEGALAALRPLCGRLDDLERAVRMRRSVDIGGGTGLGSAVYALTRIGGLLGDSAVITAAHRVADCITPQAVSEDRAFDVVSGSAGAILGLLALHEASCREDLLERAEECGHHLLDGRTADRETGAAVWATPRGAETGFAHGQAGIAYALRRLAALRPGSSFRQAAEEAEAFELHRLGARLEGTAAANRSAAWSHGAAGIGLARLAALGAGEAAPPELEAAIRLTQDVLLEGSDDLACGVMARVELLLSAGLTLDRPELVAAAHDGAASLLASAPRFRLAWRHGQFDTAFYMGLSGIGYQLLRTLDPGRFPSVLLWK